MKRWIVTKLLTYLYHAVSEDDFLRWNGSTLVMNGRALSKQEVHEIASEADTLKRMHLWQTLQTEMRWTANDAIFNKSTTADDLIFPKAVLYTLDVMTKKLDNLSKLQ